MSFTFRKFLSVQIAAQTKIFPRILTATSNERKIPNPMLIRVLVEAPKNEIEIYSKTYIGIVGT